MTWPEFLNPKQRWLAVGFQKRKPTFIQNSTETNTSLPLSTHVAEAIHSRYQCPLGSPHYYRMFKLKDLPKKQSLTVTGSQIIFIFGPLFPWFHPTISRQNGSLHEKRTTGRRRIRPLKLLAQPKDRTVLLRCVMLRGSKGNPWRRTPRIKITLSRACGNIVTSGTKNPANNPQNVSRLGSPGHVNVATSTLR